MRFTTNFKCNRKHLPKPNFGVGTNTNRLTAPAGYTMSYDAAGNLTFDNYSGEGTRTYEAENRMKQAWSSNHWQTYSYDGDGRRTRRIVNGTETWQIYGIGGELLAEYAPAASPATPKKEYGYRNGELLITAEASSGSSGSGLHAQYFDTMNFSDLKVTRTDATVDFDGGGGSPDPSVGIDTFTARWSGKVEPQYSQTYTFYTWTDDGVRLWFNGQLLIDKWIDQGPTEWSGQINLNAGQRYDLVMEYYENGGGATAKLSWSSESQAKQIIPAARLFPLVADGAFSIQWLVTDQLGTPRMVFDQTGSLANVSRHDYLPFGEELFAGTGGRTVGQGYTASDNVRQKFTQKERDNETGLDFFEARYYGSTQGRFTTPDPLLSSGEVEEPQSWNRYCYALNNPLMYTDPLGLYVFDSSVDHESQKKFNAALLQARTNLSKIADVYGSDSKQYKKAEAALKIYGALGEKNGVTIALKDMGGKDGTTVAGVKGAITPQNPTGQNIRVAFDPSTFTSDTFDVRIAHEGSHAAAGSEWVKNNFPNTPSDYQDEFNAYIVSSLFMEANYPTRNVYVPLPYYKAPGKNPYLPDKVDLWRPEWKGTDRATLQAFKGNVDYFLSRPEKAGGYNLRSDSTKPAFLKGARMPK